MTDRRPKTYRVGHEASSHPADVVLLLVLLLVGCAGPSGPTELDAYQLPSEDLSLDSLAVVTNARLLYSCQRWGPDGVPTERLVLADIFFGALDGESSDHPQERDVRAVIDNGGRVLFQFNYPGLRVYAPTRQLPAIVNAINAGAAFTVPNPRRFDWQMSVGIIDPKEDDLIRFQALGGRVKFTFNGGLVGSLPNRSVPVLRADPRVTHVQNSVQLCFF